MIMRTGVITERVGETEREREGGERGLVEARNEPAAKFIFVHYAHVQRYNKESFVSGDAC